MKKNRSQLYIAVSVMWGDVPVQRFPQVVELGQENSMIAVDTKMVKYIVLLWYKIICCTFTVHGWRAYFRGRPAI